MLTKYVYFFTFFQDFHLAKRWYDRSLTTNKIAVLPVSLSLAKLNARFIWSYLTGGETGADASSFWSIGSGKASSGRGSANKDASSGDATAAGEEQAVDQGANKNENGGDAGGNGWDLNKIGNDGVKKWTNQKQAGPSSDSDPDDTERFQQRHNRQPGGAEGEDDEMFMDDEELVESVVIIGLCMVVGYLMYVRQFRFGNQQQPQQQGNQNNDGNNNNGNQQQPQQPPMGGLPGDPNAPGRFAYYAAGG